MGWTGGHQHPRTSDCHCRKARHMSDHTNLVCMYCGHIQPVQSDQIPSHYEHCRESFTAHGYFLLDDTTDAEDLSQDASDTNANAGGGTQRHDHAARSKRDDPSGHRSAGLSLPARSFV